jgi:hypothetical protein
MNVQLGDAQSSCWALKNKELGRIQQAAAMP